MQLLIKKSLLYIFFLVQLFKCKTIPVIPWKVIISLFWVFKFFIFLFFILYFIPHRIIFKISKARGSVLSLQFVDDSSSLDFFCFSASTWPSSVSCLLEHKHRRDVRLPANPNPFSLHLWCSVTQACDWQSNSCLRKEGGRGETGGWGDREKETDRGERGRQRERKLYNGTQPRSRSIRVKKERQRKPRGKKKAKYHSLHITQ